MNIIYTTAPLFILIFGIIGTVCALLFINIVVFYRRSRTLNALLVFNTAIAGLITNITFISQAISQLVSDGNDSLYSFRGLVLSAGTGLLFHTLCVQALYHLFATVLSTRRYLISTYSIICFVMIQWIFSITFGIPILLIGRITYQTVGRVCLVPMSDTFSFIYFGMFNYVIPLSLINGIYIRIIQYMKRSSLIMTARRNIIERQRRKIRVIRRIYMTVIIPFLMGFSYLIFFLILQFYPSFVPDNIDTICPLFIGLGLALSILINLINTKGVKNILSNIKRSYAYRLTIE